MPTLLPNGLEIFNSTPHELVFYDPEWEGEEYVVVDSDKVISCEANNNVVKVVNGIRFVTLKFQPRELGLEIIQGVRTEHPKALIVGSVIAAETYREEVVAPVPWFRGDRGGKRTKQPVMKANRFTIFLKEI